MICPTLPEESGVKPHYAAELPGLDPERWVEEYGDALTADPEAPLPEEQGAFGTSGLGKEGWVMRLASVIPASAAGLAAR